MKILHLSKYFLLIDHLLLYIIQCAQGIRRIVTQRFADVCVMTRSGTL